MVEYEEDYFNADTMKRLEHKGKLIADINYILKDVSKYKQVYFDLGFYGRRIRKKIVKTVYKDFVKGIKVVNDKFPVYVELPKVRSVSDDGTISKQYEGQEVPTEFDCPSPFVRRHRD